jgi:hypothetical protein
MDGRVDRKTLRELSHLFAFQIGSVKILTSVFEQQTAQEARTMRPLAHP